MRESSEELDRLQGLLGTSLSGATAHLRSIVGTAPRASAAQVAAMLHGMCTLAVSTVTAQGEPRISAVDGHFLHGMWHFGTARGAAKARHLDARPQVSVALLRGEELGVFVHGTAETLNPAGRPADPEWPEVLAYLQEFYGADAFDWEHDVVYFRVRPHWMAVYAPALAEPAPEKQ
ncbi:pyridoxamine 5'-phosphate oxidase family protein [Yinghuangia soli]|uniref:Pyridoxamine 5'-phosphate oxidase family protein n=1 Tax=Yinghuangia soli TaxID=2908204 RepID=A0AA41Q5E7_9ACTN|nr:pyridoxamine 5'-phosphate oxidase family protein [Yinghuangia soli]MCF2531626.1 pyridoxamine 5'-phosphate oxidase family protein [Yinghuangia soli]